MMIAPNVAALILVFCAGANMSIGVYVLSRNPRSATHRAFFLFTVPVSVWAFGLAMFHGYQPSSLWSMELAFAGASLIPIGMLSFAERFPESTGGTSIVNRWLFTPMGVTFSLLSWSSWMLRDVELSESGVRLIYGPFHKFFAAYMLACLCLGIRVLYSTFRGATGLLRLQTRYLLIAIAGPAAMAVTTNLLLPLLLGTSTTSRYGPFFSLIMVGLIGHAIIRHRFMDIRVVIKQGVV
jgi:N-terminal 7TM region of histidine kinase